MYITVHAVGTLVFRYISDTVHSHYWWIHNGRRKLVSVSFSVLPFLPS